MDDRLIPLAAGSPPVDEAAWRALVEKTLDGASFESRLMTGTYDGIAIQPLYTAANSAPPLPGPLRARPPFDEARAWDIRARVDHPDPAKANALALGDLEGGATSLLIGVDPSGETGVAVASQADLEQVLDGVLLDLAPVALDAGFLGPQAAGWLHAVAEARTLKPHLRFNLDPLTAFAMTGGAPGPIEAHIAEAAKTGARLPAESAFLATGRAAHEAGGSEAQELGLMAAAALAYARAMTVAGMSAEAAFGAITLGVSLDADYFAAIAKLRAARAIFGRISEAVCGAPVPARIEARSSRRMLSPIDPWVNMLRLTAAGFAGAVGDADAVALDAFTEPLGRPSPFARRQARNVQLVLMEESHLGQVFDPAGGAWYVETLTDDFARAGWAFFQAIEKAGGAAEALKSGVIAEAVDDARAKREADIAKRKTGLVGVSEYAPLSDSGVEIDQVDAAAFAKATPDVASPGANGACPPLLQWRTSNGFADVRRRAKALGAPTAYLATLGGPRNHGARADFARNLLAAGGVAALAGPPADYRPAETPVAVICGSDALYQTEAANAARALKAAGARRVLLAGRPGELEAALKEAGVDGFIYVGADVLAALGDVLTAMGAAA